MECPNWKAGTRRCNCKACRARRRAAALEQLAALDGESMDRIATKGE
jgi:hypothetical protein